MTRRDTIIIAVFVNAAILIGLFISAVRSDKGEDKASLATTNEASVKIGETSLAKSDGSLEPKTDETGKTEIKTAEGDEVDLVLKQFAQSAPQLAQSPAPNVLASPSQPVDFAQDLQALMTAPSAQPAVVSPSVSAPSSTALLEVTVRKGDVLEKIARAHQTTVRDIMKLNGLKNANLRVGQVLKVAPGMRKKGPAVSTVASNSTHENGPVKYYVVKNGDNPWSIAVKNHMKLEELLRLNNMDETKARRLKAGDKIRIQ